MTSTRLLKVIRLFQLRVLGLGLFQNWGVGVCVFPDVEEVLVRRLRLGGITCHRVSTADLKVSQRPCHKVPYDAPVIQEFLEFGSCGPSVVCQQISLAA